MGNNTDEIAGAIRATIDYAAGKEMRSPYPDNPSFTEAYSAMYLVCKSMNRG